MACLPDRNLSCATRNDKLMSFIFVVPIRIQIHQALCRIAGNPAMHRSICPSEHFCSLRAYELEAIAGNKGAETACAQGRIDLTLNSQN
jgi:hypothetical protein